MLIPWYDQTVYQEDIPSNQIENWAKIQADRFENNVIRGFHTELEAVYERRKNMSLTRDNSKVQEAIFFSSFSQASLWNADCVGYTGEPKESFYHEYQELL